MTTSLTPSIVMDSVTKLHNLIPRADAIPRPSLPLAIVLRHILSSARTCSPTADALYPLQSSLELV